MQLFAIGCLALFALMLLTTALRKRNPTYQATRRRAMPRVQAVTPQANLAAEEWPAARTTSSEQAFDEEELVAAAKPIAPLSYAVLNVMMPKGQAFGGYALVQTLLSLGLRTGQDKLFHRFNDREMTNEKLFSVATANQPGTFDFDDINEFYCPGVTLFMVLKHLSNPSQAFEEMLATAQDIAEELGGEVLNERREPLSVTELAALRASIADYQQQIPQPDYLEV